MEHGKKLSLYIEKLVENSHFNTVQPQQLDLSYSIVIPVFNGLNYLKKCIDSLLKYTDFKHKIYLFNDASTDNHMQPWLEKLANHYHHITVVNQKNNVGYLKNVNQAFSATDNDVVLLNSDTQVTQNWLEELSFIAQHDKVGIVCPLSDNATILSLEKNLLKHISKLKNFSGQWYPLPTAVGSCMLIKRNILNQFGGFDEYYDPGYGEECDYSLRIRKAGYFVACAPASFVFHVGSISFQKKANSLKQLHAKLLDLRWPNYNLEIQQFINKQPLKHVENYLFNSTKKNAILHVVHGLIYKGGVELFTRELLAKLPKTDNHTVLVPFNPKNKKVLKQFYNFESHIRVIEYPIESHINTIGNLYADLKSPVLDLMFVKYLNSAHFKLVHFHSFVNTCSMSWPLICHRLKVPYLLSVHDHSFICINYSLMNTKDNSFCKKTLCSENDSECVSCLSRATQQNSDFIKDNIAKRNKLWSKILDNAEFIIFPDQYLMNLYQDKFKNSNSSRLQVIEPYFYPSHDKPILTSNHKLTVAFLGTFTFEKGAKLFLQVLKDLKHLDISWRVVGTIFPIFSNKLKKFNVNCCGTYAREDLPKLLNNCDLIVLPTIRPETYSITLTEANILGIPVIASDIGAYTRRITHNINGQLFPYSNATVLSQLIREHSEDRSLLTSIQENIINAKKPKEYPAQKVYKLYKNMDKKAVAHSNASAFTHNIEILDKPKISAYELMDKWLYSDMTLEAEGDWRTASAITIIIIGTNAQLCEMTRNNCLSYAKDAKIILLNFETKIQLSQLSQYLCIVNQGHLLNDNFGNWLYDFKLSNKAIGLADYALINSQGKMYGPQFNTRFDILNYTKQPQRTGVLLYKQGTHLNNTHHLFTQTNSNPLSEIVKDTISSGAIDAIHYFPYFSSLYPDAKWVQDWKSDLAQSINNTQEGKVYSVSIALFSCLEKPAILKQIQLLLLQKNTLIEHVYVFSNQSIQFENNKLVSGHCIDFSQMNKTVNSVLSQVTSHSILFIYDNVILKNTSALKLLLNSLKTWQIQAISPSFNLPKNPDFLVAEKLGVGHISAQGITRDARFDVPLIPTLSDLLDKDCCLINRSAWKAIGGLGVDTNGLYFSHQLSSQLDKNRISIATLAIENVYKQGIPSSSQLMPATSLSSLRESLVKENKSFFLTSKHLPIAYKSQIDTGLDEYFGTFKTPQSLPRILAYANDSWASGFYRVKAPISALVANNHISAHFLPEQRLNKIASYFEINKQKPHALLLHNFFTKKQIVALQLYKKYLAVPIILSIDDLLTEIPNYNPYSQSNPVDINDSIKLAISLADRLIVSTDFLAQEYGHLHNDIVVINNRLPSEIWKLPYKRNSSNKKLRIGWAGASQHKDDLEWLKPVIEATKEIVQWVFYGFVPDTFDLKAIEYHEATLLGQYHSTLASLKLDIAIAPLVNNNFNYAKSNLKLLEYGALGIATICSDIEPYQNSPAIRLENRPKLWIDAINKISENPLIRNDLSQKMHDWVKQNYFLEDNLLQWKKALFL